MSRKELIESAVTFLCDPSVKLAPLDDKIAFLKSKTLSDDEVKKALSLSESANSRAQLSSEFMFMQSPSSNYQQRPDWRDWFIMATATSGFAYAVYSLASKYIIPYIKPPSQSELEQDKLEIKTELATNKRLLEKLDTQIQSIQSEQFKKLEDIDKMLIKMDSFLEQAKISKQKEEVELSRLETAIDQLRMDYLPKEIKKFNREIREDLEGVKEFVKNSQNIDLKGKALEIPKGQEAQEYFKIAQKPELPTWQKSGFIPDSNDISNPEKFSNAPVVRETSEDKKPVNERTRSEIPEWQLANEDLDDDDDDS